MAKRGKSSNSPVELPGDDRISNLPDGIRCHILSFLSTKDAVATTALSTKWKDLWTTALTDITFSYYSEDFLTDGECKSRNMKFARFANKVLLFHKLPVVKRFTLNCTQDSLYDVYSWVSMTVRKKVEDLCLSIEAVNDAPIQLPTRLFTCDTLEVLRLVGHIFVRALALYSLPKLKILELSLIHYENEETVRKLISSCPSLESLEIVRDMNDGIKNFIISSSTLKDLSIDQIDQSCWLESDLCYHVINAPGLQHLELSEGSVNGFVIENLQSLVKVNIQLSEVEGIVLYVDNFSNLLQGICNSKILNISNAMFQSAIPAHMVPKFDSLSSLEVIMDCCKWHSLQEFIKNSDRLETLVFRKYSCVKKKHLLCWRRNPKTVPICLLSSLKTMTYYGFDGLKDELRMVEYILKNAKVMQKMKIFFGHLQNTETEPQLLEKLLKFSKGSEECQVIIS